MRHSYALGAFAISLSIVAASLVHPFGPVKAQRSGASLMVGAHTNSAITKLLEQSCQNCHSERSQWPWYSYVPPFSWLTEHDVSDARRHMNLSHWESYTPDEQIGLLTDIAVEVRTRQMPLPRYLQIHPEARLSNTELKQISEWAHGERRRLKAVLDSTLKPSTD